MNSMRLFLAKVKFFILSAIPFKKKKVKLFDQQTLEELNKINTNLLMKKVEEMEILISQLSKEIKSNKELTLYACTTLEEILNVLSGEGDFGLSSSGDSNVGSGKNSNSNKKNVLN